MEGNAKLQTSASVALLVGPGLGGLVAQAAGAARGVLIDAVPFLGVTGRSARPAARAGPARASPISTGQLPPSRRLDDRQARSVDQGRRCGPRQTNRPDGQPSVARTLLWCAVVGVG